MANPFKEAEKAKKKPAGNPHIVNANEAKKEENHTKEVIEQAIPVVLEAKKDPEKEVLQKKKVHHLVLEESKLF